MEVHPPHEPVHSWRDALIHIGLMTVGLFIALSLEGLLEHLHHKHLVREARENIRIEIEHNHEATVAYEKELKDQGRVLKQGLDTMHAMQEHPHAHGSIEYSWHYRPFSDAAWTSARDTGALGYMPYSEVQRYAVLYNLQQQVSTEMSRLQFHTAEVVAPIVAQKEDFASMPADMFNQMTKDAATSMLDIGTLSDFMQILDGEYTQELKQK